MLQLFMKIEYKNNHKVAFIYGDDDINGNY